MFSENYDVVIKWLGNQILSGKSDSIFSSEKSAMRSFKKLDENLIVSDQDKSDLDHFIHVHLNKSGMVKLKTTVRIFKKRSAEKSMSSTLLQCTLYGYESRKLDELVQLSGKTKIQIINELIRSANKYDFAISTEEQLDLTL